MNWKSLGIASILTLAIAGCGDNSKPAVPTPPKTVPAPTTAPAAVTTAPKPAATVPAPAANMSMPAMSMPAPAATLAAAAATVPAAATSTADGLLATATQAIKDKKWDIADGAVAQLDKLKPSLPTEYGPKIDQLKTALDAAKALTQPGIRL